MLASKAEVVALFTTKYSYLSTSEIDAIYEKSLTAYIDRAFPFQHTIVAIPESRPRAYQWIYDCMEELTEKGGGAYVQQYKENGIDINYGAANLSEHLLSRINPMVGMPQ